MDIFHPRDEPADEPPLDMHRRRGVNDATRTGSNRLRTGFSMVAAGLTTIGYYASGFHERLGTTLEDPLLSSNASMIDTRQSFSLIPNATEKPSLPQIETLSLEEQAMIQQALENYLFVGLDLARYPASEHNGILTMAQALQAKDWAAMERAAYHCPSFSKDLQRVERLGGNDPKKEALIHNANRIRHAVHTNDRAMTVELLEEYKAHLEERKKFLTCLEEILGLPPKALLRLERMALKTMQTHKAYESLSGNKSIKLPLLGTLSPEDVQAETHKTMIGEYRLGMTRTAEEFGKKGLQNAHDGLIAFAVAAQQVRGEWSILAQEDKKIVPSQDESPHVAQGGGH